MLRREKGFTLIELLIVIAIIGILAAIAIPMYKSQTIKAKLTEITNSMSATAAAVAAYYQETYAFPPDLADVSAIMNTLGVSIPDSANSRIETVSVGDGNGVITFTCWNIDSSVDSLSLVMTPSTTNEGAIRWLWSGTIPSNYIPKK